ERRSGGHGGARRPYRARIADVLHRPRRARAGPGGGRGECGPGALAPLAGGRRGGGGVGAGSGRASGAPAAGGGEPAAAGGWRKIAGGRSGAVAWRGAGGRKEGGRMIWPAYRSRYLAALTAEELRALPRVAEAVVVVPVGAIEQ